MSIPSTANQTIHNTYIESLATSKLTARLLYLCINIYNIANDNNNLFYSYFPFKLHQLQQDSCPFVSTAVSMQCRIKDGQEENTR